MSRYLVCHLTPSELGDILVQSCGLAKFWAQSEKIYHFFSGLGKMPTFPSDFPQIHPAEPPQTAPGAKIMFFDDTDFHCFAYQLHLDRSLLVFGVRC